MKNWVCIVLLITGFSSYVYADIGKVQSLLEKKEYILAVKELKGIIGSEPENTQAMDILLSTYLKMGRNRSFIVSLDRFLSKGYTPSIASLKEGVRLSQIFKDYNRTLNFTRLINSQNREDADNLNSMGLALYYLKEYSMALGASEFSVLLEPQNYVYLSNTARIYLALGDKSHARQYYRKALAINPNFGRARIELGKLVVPVVKPNQEDREEKKQNNEISRDNKNISEEKDAANQSKTIVQKSKEQPTLTENNPEKQDDEKSVLQTEKDSEEKPFNSNDISPKEQAS